MDSRDAKTSTDTYECSGSLHRVWANGKPAALGTHASSFPLTDEGAVRLAQAIAFPDDRVWVRSMMNQSLDGSLTGADGTSASLGNPTDFFALTILRALPDVIVAGAGTVRGEDYRRPSGRACVRTLGLRPQGAEYPALAILTKSGDIPESIDASWPTYLVTPAGNRDAVVDRTGFPHDHVIAAETPADCISALAQLGFRGIQLEGGAHALGDFLAAGVVNELAWTRSHLTVGGDYPRVTAGPGHTTTWRLRDMFIGPHATLTLHEGHDS